MEFDLVYRPTVGHIIRCFCHIQVNYHHGLSGISSRWGCVLAVSHTHNVRLLLEKSMLTSVAKFLVFTTCRGMLFAPEPCDSETVGYD